MKRLSICCTFVGDVVDGLFEGGDVPDSVGELDGDAVGGFDFDGAAVGG